MVSYTKKNQQQPFLNQELRTVTYQYGSLKVNVHLLTVLNMSHYIYLCVLGEWNNDWET